MTMTFERHPDTQTVVDALRGVNDEITYKSLANRCKLSLARTKDVLTSARNILANEKILFGVIRGEGLRRLGDVDKTKLPPRRMKRINGQAKRILKETDTIEKFELLPQDSRQQVTTYRTIANAIRQQASVKVVNPPRRATASPLPDVISLVQMKSE